MFEAEVVEEQPICNRCGKTIEERKDGYPTIVEASGGYFSKALFDGNRYFFSMCEDCLVNVMGSFKVPPMVREDTGDVVAWADEREQIRQRDERNRKSQEAYDAAVRGGLCTHREGWGIECCGTPKDAVACGEAVCTLHLVDVYAMCSTQSHIVIVDGDRTITHEEILEMGRSFLRMLQSGFPAIVVPWDRHKRSIWISTLFSLLLNAKTARAADMWLELLTLTRPPKATVWAGHRISGAFPPHSSDLAAIANDWITWGRTAGYLNATAHAMLGRDADSLWQYDGPPALQLTDIGS
jgi:hypothetical protein